MYARSWRTSGPPWRPVSVRLDCTPLSDPARQCRGPGDHHDCPRPALHRANRPPCAACVPPARARRAAAPSSRPHTIATIFDVGPCEGSGAQLLFRAWGSLSLLAFLLHDFWILSQKSNCATEPMTYPTASTLSQQHRKGNVPTLGTDDQGITTHDSPLSTTHCPGESAQREYGIAWGHSSVR